MRDREDLPIDDFTINDDELFMGDLVPGLIITHCEGRETLPLEVNTTDYRFNGSVVNYTRYPSRELVFDFDLFTEDNDWFREATNVLNEQLNRDYCEIRFNDDGEHFYRGYFTMGEVERYANHLQGQFKFICIDPFRYSDEVTKVNGVYDSNNSCTLSPHYGEYESGAVPTKPVLHVQFNPNASGDITADGDCGYVAFMTSDGDVLQVGDPSAVSSQTSTGTFAFCNKTSLTTLDGIEYPLPNKYATHLPVAGTITPNKSWKDTYYNKGAGKTFYCYDYLGFDASNYPGGPGWGVNCKAKDNRNFTISGGVHYFKTAVTQQLKTTLTMFGQKISEGTSGTEYAFAKLTVNLPNGTNNASVFAQVLDAYAIQTSYDCSEYNTRTGKTKRTENRQYYTDSKKKTKTSKVTKYYTSTYTYTTPNNQMSIVKSGDTMTFNWGGLTGKVTDDRLLDYRLTYVSVQYSDYANARPYEYWDNFKVTCTSSLEEPANKLFRGGQHLILDTRDASIYVKNAEDSFIGDYEEGNRPDLGALGNDWEKFELDKYVEIKAIWSDWVPVQYRPKVWLEYRKKYF